MSNQQQIGQPLQQHDPEPSEESKSIVALFSDMRGKQLDFLDATGKSLIERIATFLTVLFAVTALSGTFPPAYLKGNTTANVLRQQGRVTEAIKLYEQSLNAKQELGDVREIATTQANLGCLLWQQGEYIKALAMVWQAYKNLPERNFPLDTQGIQGILKSFKKNFASEEQAFDALWLQATSEPQPSWLNEVQVGSSASNVTLTEEEVAEIVEAVKAFVNVENWDATQQVVEAQQEILFRPETELVFEWNIEQSKAGGEQRVVEMLEMHLAVLRACKADGIAATFERMRELGQGEG